MAWGQSGGLGVDTAAADAYGGNRGEVETAGGIEMGGAAGAADLANALADALAGGDYYDPGAVAAQDIAAQEAEASGFDEDEAYEGQMMAAAAAPSQQVDEFGQMQRQAEADIAAQDFNQWGGPYSTGFNTPVAGPTVEETQMGMAAPMFGQAAPAQGYQDILGSGAGLAQATQFAGPQTTAPGQSTSPYSSDYGTYATPQASQYGAMRQLGLTGHQFAQGNPIGYAGPNSQFMSTSQNVEDQIGGAAVDSFTNMPLGDPGTMATEQFDSGIAGESGATQGQGGVSMNVPGGIPGGYGMISGGTTGPMKSTGGQGAITAGTVSASPETAAGEAAVAAGTAGTQAQISQDVNAVKQEAAQYVTPTQTAIDLEVQNTSARLDQEAAQKREQYGTFSKEYQKAQRIANAFKTLDAYSKSYSSVHGKSFLGELLGGKFSLTGAIKSVEGWLQDKFGAQAAGQTGEQIAAMLEEAYNKGTLNEVLRKLQGGGPSTEDVEGPKEIRAFIQQYPWAAELDPRYIKYLIDNPAELQDLLGEKEGV
jgi:hypothetical protein